MPGLPTSAKPSDDRWGLNMEPGLLSICQRGKARPNRAGDHRPTWLHVLDRPSAVNDNPIPWDSSGQVTKQIAPPADLDDKFRHCDMSAYGKTVERTQAAGNRNRR